MTNAWCCRSTRRSFKASREVRGSPAGTVPLVGFHKYVATLVNAGIQIPHGLTMPVSIAHTESRGIGRMRVYGKTTAQLFPNTNVVIPMGTELEGDAVLSGGSWTIHWEELSVRGVHTQISAVNQQMSGKPARPERDCQREVRTMRARRRRMGRKTLLLLAVATLGVFSAVGMRATNFQIWDVNGTTVEAMWERYASQHHVERKLHHPAQQCN